MIDDAELDRRIRALVASAANLQEFADLATPDENWARIDKTISFPRGVGGAELDCPACLDPIRLIYDRFAGGGTEVPLTCPRCGAALRVVGEFTGYTTEVHLEEA